MSARRNEKGESKIYELKIKPNFKLIFNLAQEGNKMSTIARKIGVSHSTLKRYVEYEPDLKQVFIDANTKCIETLQKTLFQTAIGFEYQESKKVRKDTDTGEWEEKEEVVTKRSLPNVNALIFLLHNLDRTEDNGSNWDHNWNTKIQRDKEIELKKADEFVDFDDKGETNELD